MEIELDDPQKIKNGATTVLLMSICPKDSVSYYRGTFISMFIDGQVTARK